MLLLYMLLMFGPGKTLNSAAGLPARVQIPVPPSATSRFLYELLDRVLGFLVVSPFRIACKSSTGSEAEAQSGNIWRSYNAFADQQDVHEAGFKPLDVKDKDYETISNNFNQGFLRVCGVFKSDVCPTCLVPPVRSFCPHFWLK
jgi:hypothetical protein